MRNKNIAICDYVNIFALGNRQNWCGVTQSK